MIPGSFNLLSEILFVQAPMVAYTEEQSDGFNLLSEILFVQARSPRGFSPSTNRFNLLSEILFVQAAGAPVIQLDGPKFQSLERDSVCSSNEFACVLAEAGRVSIS